MENFHELKPDLLSSNTLEVDEQSGSYLKDAAIWAKAIAVIALVIGGLAAIGIVVYGSLFSRGLGFGLQPYLGVIIMTVLIVLGIALIGIINLLRFSNGIVSGIDNGDVVAFDKGLNGLKVYFILIGILTLVVTFSAIIQIIA